MSLFSRLYFMLELNTFEIGLLEALALALWNSYFKKYSIVFILILLIIGRLVIQQWSLTQLNSQLKNFYQKRIWIEGTINIAKQRPNDWLLTLSDIQIRHLDIQHDKISLQLLDRRKRNLYHGRKILISGSIEKVLIQKREPHLVLSNIRTGLMLPEQTTFDYFWESLRLQLANRAKFYLSETSIQLYLPLVLGIKSYGQTYRLFKNSGLSHLLVVSGLHAGLFFFGVHYAVVFLSKWIPYLLTSPLRKWGQDLFSLLILFAYIALLGFPTPALRASVGICIFLLTKHAGISVSPLHALATAAACFLLWNPQWITDLSFQLSFVATAGLLMFRNLYISVQGRSFHNRILIYFLNSIFASSGVLLVLSPILIKFFATVSIAPLWLNALMTPLLAFFVLPVCVIALSISIIFLHSLPFSWLENNAFRLTNWILELWAGTLQKLSSENSYTLHVSHEWFFKDYIAYYTFLFLLIWSIQWFTSHQYKK